MAKVQHQRQSSFELEILSLTMRLAKMEIRVIRKMYWVKQWKESNPLPSIDSIRNRATKKTIEIFSVNGD